jgi:hypothetical protein
MRPASKAAAMAWHRTWRWAWLPILVWLGGWSPQVTQRELLLMCLM